MLQHDREARDARLLREKDAEIERLRAALKPFAEIARRLEWSALGDEDMELNDHILEAPADDIAPSGSYVLHVSDFRNAARALEQRDDHANR